jgi:phage terminase large subunit-like protein
LGPATATDVRVHDQLSLALDSTIGVAGILPAPLVIRGDRLHHTDMPPQREECLWVVQSWDLAFTANSSSNFSVCTTWGFSGARWFLLDVHRDRLEFPDLRARLIALQRQWTADKILIEPAQAAQLGIA